MLRPILGWGRLGYRPLHLIAVRRCTPASVADVKTSCVLAGYPKSGRPLALRLPSLYPSQLVSNELDVLGYVL
jgi:hypothetical protein